MKHSNELPGTPPAGLAERPRQLDKPILTQDELNGVKVRSFFNGMCFVLLVIAGCALLVIGFNMLLGSR